MRRDSETGTAVSLFFYDTDGKKHCGAFRGGNRSFHPDMVTDEMLKSARHMHIGSFVALESFHRAARRNSDPPCKGARA